MPQPQGTTRHVIIEAPSGERFEADVPIDTLLKELALDFFQAQNWPLYDHHGRGQRVVVEWVDPDDPDQAKRLNGEMDLEKACIEDGDILRILPESIAGAVDFRARQAALQSDFKDMERLREQNPNIDFPPPKRSHAPDHYEVILRFSGFSALPDGEPLPRRASEHRVEIVLGADYPRVAPRVKWLTPIFHPNIAPDGRVCLGVLQERYLPGMRLVRLVRMLSEMVQWRNFDSDHPFNPAAAAWAASPLSRKQIEEIGGFPYQEGVDPLRIRDRPATRRITFRPMAG